MEKAWDIKFRMDNFNIKYTLDCGQCFRWREVENKKDTTYEYVGAIEDRVIRIRQEKDKFYVTSNKKEGLKEAVYNYFDLYTDYSTLENEIAKIDHNISSSLKYSSGLHLLNQPVFETIISYIISANNNIKRISGSVEKISEMYGTEVKFEGSTYYLFPTLNEFAKVTSENMLSCGVGFRARYIVNTVKRLIEDSSLLKEYGQMESEQLKKELLSYMGIGPKVAECIMLFSMGKRERFPIDIWVKRVMEKLYMRENTSMKEIAEYARTNFKGNSGIVQQHLFYNIREGNI